MTSRRKARRRLLTYSQDSAGGNVDHLEFDSHKKSHRTLFSLFFFFGCSTGPVLRSAVLEDCVLCQEAISSSEVAAKAREGQFEGQITHKHPPPPES